jgi:16S rRNA (guanine527-N7)-methyltransferase
MSAAAAALSADRERALTLTPVSRETLARLDRFVELLLARQRQMNMIAASTEATVWTRHVADSLQLLPLMPAARVWVDLGSGGGFPGLVIACALADVDDAHVHLVESIGKKATFLREAAADINLPATVHAGRIEEFVENVPGKVDVVTARAVAPLPKLLGLAYPLLRKGAVGLFPKGRDMAAELTDASIYWRIRSHTAKSRTDPKAGIVIVEGLESALGAQMQRAIRGQKKGRRLR